MPDVSELGAPLERHGKARVTVSDLMLMPDRHLGLSLAILIPICGVIGHMHMRGGLVKAVRVIVHRHGDPAGRMANIMPRLDPDVSRGGRDERDRHEHQDGSKQSIHVSPLCLPMHHG